MKTEKPEFGILTKINVADISAHKDNPRRDLGDLTELAESIKINGVLQNLTVVPVYGEISNQWHGKYTVVIGHRRLAAAKLAGLDFVPCIVSDMNSVQQIRTMLTENMQRIDLSIYEQAQGFQMMLDLGDSVTDISERTGFSESTVRRRVKLLELEEKGLYDAAKRGATIMDFARLDDVKDEKAKNRLLEFIGTNNFERELQVVIDREKRAALYEQRIKAIKSFATYDENVGYPTHLHVMSYHGYNEREVEIPEDANTTQYFYRSSGFSIELYKERDNTEEMAKEEQREEQHRQEAETRREIDEIFKAMHELRFNFVKKLSNATCKKNLAIIAKLYGELAEGKIFGSSWFDPDAKKLMEIFDIKSSGDDEEDLKILTNTETIEKSPEKYLFSLIYLEVDESKLQYCDRRWIGGRVVYAFGENPALDTIYESLIKLGYEMSDEEIALQNGTHELFTQANPEE